MNIFKARRLFPIITQPAIQGGAWTVVAAPDAAFSWLPFTIEENGGLFRALLPLQAYAGISVTKTYYVDRAMADDTGNGLTPETAKQKLSSALALADADRIYVKSGTYEPGYGWDYTTPVDRDLEVIGYGGPVYCSVHAVGLSWSAVDSHYEASYTTAIGSVVDASAPDADGDFIPLTYQASAALVDANAGSWFYDADLDLIYVNTLDSRAPDADIFCYYNSGNGRWSRAKKLYLEGLEFRGGATAAFLLSSSSASCKLYAKSCKFMYAANGSAGRDGFSVSGGGEVIAQQCIAARCGNDGYHFDVNTVSANVALIGCIGRNNGKTGVSNANYASRHDAAPTVHINCIGFGNWGRQIQDVGASGLIWMLGCNLHDPNGGSDINYAIAGTDSKLWLDGCTSSGATDDLEAGAGATLYHRNMTPASPETTGAGTITTY